MVEIPQSPEIEALNSIDQIALQQVMLFLAKSYYPEAKGVNAGCLVKLSKKRIMHEGREFTFAMDKVMG